MSLFYLDEQIVFDEDSYLLYANAAESTEPLRVGAIASSCLAQLLRAKGCVVLKRDLMAGAWGQFGLEVTDNSLAQVVRQLRLAFTKLQPDVEYIVTLPRIGYKLAESIQVREADAGSPRPAVPVEPTAPAEPAEPAASIMSTITTVLSRPISMHETVPAAAAKIATTTAEAPEEIAPHPAPHTPPSTASWKFNLFILLSCLLAFSLTAAWQARPLAVDALQFSDPIKLPQLLIFLPLKSPTPTTAELTGWAAHAHDLATISKLQADPIHFYLLDRRELMGFICDAPLATVTAYCVGVSEHVSPR